MEKQMRKRLFLILPLLAGLLFTSCKEVVAPEPPVAVKNYFPLPNNTVYKYAVDSVSETNAYFNIAQKNVSFGPEVVVAGTPYYTQTEVTIFNDGNIVTQRPKVRKTERGLYYYIDTSGTSALIPDTVRPFVQIDREVIAMTLPFFPGQSWSAFKFNVAIVPLISVTASYVGSAAYSYDVWGLPSRVNAEIVKYELKITIPDLGTGPVNLTYTGEVWYSEDLGVVMREGDYFLFQLLAGSEIDLLAPNYKVRERLTEIVR